MMINEDFFDIAFKNIELIKSSKTESLKESEFYYKYSEDFTKKEIIDFLIRNNYIETEIEDYIYYLTPETYELTDFDLYTSIELDYSNENEFLNEFEQDDEKNEYFAEFDRPEPTEAEIVRYKEIVKEQRKKERLKNFAILSFFIVILILAGWYFDNTPQKNKILTPKTLEQIKADVEKHTDSLKNILKQKK